MDDEARFTRIVEGHASTVYRLAYSYLRSRFDADDVAQTVLVRLYRDGRWRPGADRAFQSDEHLRNWLVRVTINECRTLFRRLRRTPDDLACVADTLPAEGVSPEDAAEARELLEVVMRLPVKYRVPIYLRYYEGYSAKEVAGLLDVPESTVRTRLARARTRLGEMLASTGCAGGAHAVAGGSARAPVDAVPARAAPPAPCPTATMTTRCEGKVIP